ncbi:hypothetical protein B2G71_07205 [Novosphingobium sp. PC22D]|uniref:DUF262 domain-containing protein n=1 Tax=Novosphingobium sp. PC22D TaxID=1962403 RepID=UPI000BFB03C1|nr:DUF262 domain-containing protein [Novosphingobium sp. PC22D]PEQ13221.1 hypothetical protein B2G71_07205 [Novosphingobium sp. PC22D]
MTDNHENIHEREIRTTAVDFSFGELLNLHRDAEVVIRPEYQRLFRWSNEQRSRLIESIIMGLPIPPIFLIENETGILELIDGLQRTSSVLQFLDHEAIDQPELVLEGCDFIRGLNGKTMKTIDTVTRLKIKRTPIRATIINRSGDAFVKYELFKRLNTGGSLLSAQEIRNCSSRMVGGGAEFYELLQSLAQVESFVTATARLPATMVEQRANEELVLRFFALMNSRDTFKGNIEEWLDGYMEDILFERSEFDHDAMTSLFERTFAVISTKLGDQAFTRFNSHGEATGRLAPAYYEAVCVAFVERYDELRSIAAEDLLSRLQSAFESEGFKNATGPGANTIAKLQQRIQVVQEHLSDEAPA